MKRIIILIGLLVFALTARSQSPADELFEKYGGKEGFTTVIITKYMFDMFSNIEPTDPEAKEMSEVLRNLTGIKILTSESKDAGVNFLKEMEKKIAAGNYKELMVIKEKDENLRFLALEQGDKISELLLIVSGEGNNVLISIQGDIDMKNISKLAKAMDIEGMEKLENIEK